jgi:hypothetical protein
LKQLNRGKIKEIVVKMGNQIKKKKKSRIHSEMTGWRKKVR